MRLTILGGGGFRVPLVYRALLDDPARSVSELVLHDTDARRLAVIAAVLTRLAQGLRRGPPYGSRTGWTTRCAAPDFVFSRDPGGRHGGPGRDERIPLAEGVLGQETVGAGGVLYGLRTIPVAVHIAERVRGGGARTPGSSTSPIPRAWSPRRWRGCWATRVIGICDSPVGLVRRAARAAGADPDASGTRADRYDYVGLNHLGWLRSLTAGRPRPAAGAARRPGRARLLRGGPALRRRVAAALGALPNEYLHYYYFRRETLAPSGTAARPAASSSTSSRAASSSARRRPAARTRAYELWERTRLEREETYMARQPGGHRRLAARQLRSGRRRLRPGGAGADARHPARRAHPADPQCAQRDDGSALAPDAIVETVCEVTARAPGRCPAHRCGRTSWA